MALAVLTFPNWYREEFCLRDQKEPLTAVDYSHGTLTHLHTITLG
jgi:hypothetical protein